MSYGSNLKDGLESHMQLVLPKSLREEALQELHEGAISGHLGEEKTLTPRRDSTVLVTGMMYAIGSGLVQHVLLTAPKRRAPLQTVRAGSPMQVVAVDILGPLPE